MLRDSNTAAAADSSALLHHRIVTLCTCAPAIHVSTACTCLRLPTSPEGCPVGAKQDDVGSAFRHTSPVMLLSCGVSTTRAGPAAHQAQASRAEADQQGSGSVTQGAERHSTASMLGPLVWLPQSAGSAGASTDAVQELAAVSLAHSLSAEHLGTKTMPMACIVSLICQAALLTN